MKQDTVRRILAAGLAISFAFAAWSWLRPYAWRPDSTARCKVVETLVTRDGSFDWINVHLKVNSGMEHDLSQPVVLETAAGGRTAPADATLGGKDPKQPEELWFRFWLEQKDLSGPLNLHINGGSLVVKSTSGMPALEEGASRNFTTHRW